MTTRRRYVSFGVADLLFFDRDLLAVPAPEGPVTLEQPGDASPSVLMFGDEYGLFVETADRPGAHEKGFGSR